MQLARHAFLSYCRDDKDVVRSFRHELVENGIEVWWDDEILPGQDWKHEIRKAIRQAYAVVVCLSATLESRKRSGVYPELLDAIAELRNRVPGEVFVIPVRLCNCEIPDVQIDATRTLESLQRVDLFPDSERKREFEKLVFVLNQKAGKDGACQSGPSTIRRSI